MRNSFLLFLAFLLIHHFSISQNASWVFFSDKGPDVPHLIQHPEQFLSESALARRTESNIQIEFSDLPLYHPYVQGISSKGHRVLARSKWLNAIAVEGSSEMLQQLADFPFVNGIEPCQSYSVGHLNQENELVSLDDEPLDYGKSLLQVDMLNLVNFHEAGFTGRGMTIATLDAGFPGADTINVFDSLHLQNRVIATYDFVEDTSWVYHANPHGTQVLSTMAANMPGAMIGTAPHANYILARTENARKEYQGEEYNMVEALEWVDSIGVDVVNISLGYYHFDDGQGSYTYEDLDGNKGISTRAVERASAKGILVIVSAGNEGSSRWHYITVPCDADSILCVGSVDKKEEHSSFSSYGPRIDGKVKPEIVAMGTRTIVATPYNRFSAANGTSAAAPLVSGMVACLRQAHPERNHMDLIKAIILSTNRLQTPDSAYGYGIPDIIKADSFLLEGGDLSKIQIVTHYHPERGISYAENPQTLIEFRGKKLSGVTSEGAIIEDVEIGQGNRKVILAPELFKVKDESFQIKTKYLLKGDYYLHVITNQYEEYIPFSIK